MILVGLGANLDFEGRSPVQNLESVVRLLADHRDVDVVACSPWYRTLPVGKTDQPDYINGVVRLKTEIAPLDLMRLLLQFEIRFGRVRAERWGPRTMDLDLLDFDSQILDLDDEGVALKLPHPRAHERAFVLQPLADIAPDWTHPVWKQKPADFLEKFGGSQGITQITGKDGALKR